MKYQPILNDFGYFEASPKPTIDELKDHYENKYYQESKGTYSTEYSEDELRHFSNIAHLSIHTSRKLNLDESLLDLGCGEGFFSKFFHKLNWSISCCDFSEFGISKHNPEILDFFQSGDIHNSIELMTIENRKFGLVNLQNVLEHVIDPISLLKLIKPLIKTNGAVRIRVPNDYSPFQMALIDHEMTHNSWFNAPEHLSYFNKTGLTNILNQCGFTIRSIQADFPIEIFLANQNSNYWKDRSLGKEAHRARVFCENHLIETDIDNFLTYSEAAGALGFGRELIAYASISEV